ncbi:hypothetical protein ABS772_25880 [Methylorubrum podarium]|uniref:PRC-barrel domain-containing protein n=1 Tax=Methylorubrum podarium TaxID=200476 RepID=A0ABV1QVE3_9HYPH
MIVQIADDKALIRARRGAMPSIDSGACDEDWDQDLADDLIGSSLLVGLTYVDSEGVLLSREQVFGIVETVDAQAGIVIRTRDEGEPFTVAPLLEAIEVGEPGLYQLADQDRIVENPDFTALFTVTKPRRN